jgi:hypothetical protein
MSHPTQEKAMAEPKITINGRELTEAQAMTLRVALNSFLSDLAAEGLGDDEHGKRMTEAYLQRGSEINLLMMSAPDSSSNAQGEKQ